MFACSKDHFCSRATIFSLSEQTIPSALLAASLLWGMLSLLYLHRKRNAIALAVPAKHTALLGNLSYSTSSGQFYNEQKEEIYFTSMQRSLMRMLMESEEKKVSMEDICRNLWPGKDNAKESLYTLVRRLKPIVESNTNLKIVADKGFFLNGEHLKLKGVCRHQERSEVGNVLRKEHHEEDAAIIAEMGTNAIRLAHYPQASYMYDLMDHYGIIVWAEIPFVGPGGYLDRGFVDQPAFRENGKEQLKELIRQHYNHPSICFWGLFNELKTYGDNPTEYVKELNQLAKLEDPTRLTTAASNISANDPIGMVSDLIAWNQYFGWYGGHPSDMGTFLDKTHQEFPNLKIAISEYGAGASIYHQQDSIKPGIASGYWHPENYQTFYHMENWKALAERPFVWGSFVWNMFDFGAAHREEGDRPGVNDKGLVTRDRKTRKDAFYFYKANWNQKDAFVYIANRRHRERICKETDIMVFSNQPEVELFINGISQGKQQADAYATFQWKSIQLTEGENKIEVKAGKKKDQVTDSVIWHL